MLKLLLLMSLFSLDREDGKERLHEANIALDVAVNFLVR